MQLDVILPTLNRSAQMRRAATSILTCAHSDQLCVRVVIVDNNSTDDTAAAAARLTAEFPRRVLYALERRPGKSHALNHGVALSTADLIGFVDDDEAVDEHWLSQIWSAFAQAEVDFVGGRYVPVWPSPPPEWLPSRYRAVTGVVDGGDEVRAYGRSYQGVLVGGNAVIRRSVLDRVGQFRPALGPRADRRLLSCEDEDMYLRLLDAGAFGLYLPRLAVRHYIDPIRLTKRYHRRWCFWHGVSKAVLQRYRPGSAVRLAGAPRYMFGDLLRAVLAVPATLVRKNSASARFDAELAAWDLAGFLYGRYVFGRSQEAAGGERQKQTHVAAVAGQ
jgi:glycosyltransferase involved in cell wall biosynthesis